MEVKTVVKKKKIEKVTCDTIKKYWQKTQMFIYMYTYIL
jgi:hypothetical protein